MSNEKGNLIYAGFDHNGNQKISIEKSIFGFNIASFSDEKQLKKILKEIRNKNCS